MYLGTSVDPQLFVLAMPSKVDFSVGTIFGPYVDMSTPTGKCTMDVYALTVEGESHLEISGALHVPPPPNARPSSMPLWSVFKSNCESVIGPMTEADPSVAKNQMIFQGCAYLATRQHHAVSAAPAPAASSHPAVRPSNSQANASLLANQV